MNFNNRRFGKHKVTRRNWQEYHRCYAVYRELQSPSETALAMGRSLPWVNNALAEMRSLKYLEQTNANHN